MNTPAHAILNVTILARGAGRERAGPVLAGALLPDLPMFGFYLWERLVRGASEALIWSERYFQGGWQNFFDLFNSIPLIAALIAIGAWRENRALVWLGASMALHVALDLPLHHDDAHRHFFPLSDWRFASPLSYWDPLHHGVRFLLLETLGVVAGSVLLWRRFRGRPARVALAAANALYLAGGVYWWLHA